MKYISTILVCAGLWPAATVCAQKWEGEKRFYTEPDGGSGKSVQPRGDGCL